MIKIHHVLLLCACVLLFTGKTYALPVDLTMQDMFVKKGFSHEWTAELPTDDTWKKIPGAKTTGRKLRVYELGLEGLPKRTFPFAKDNKAEHFTFITGFNLTKEQSTKILGIFLAQIGINWEIYINSHLVKKEVFLTKDGDISRQRNLRQAALPINPCFLKEGENILAFHIIGDPAYTDTGFYRMGPYRVDIYENIAATYSRTTQLILTFLYLGVGLFHLFLFMYRTADRFYLYYGLFSVMIFVYYYFQNPIISSYIPDTALIYQIKIIALYTPLPFIGAFIDYLLSKKVSRFVKGLGIYTALMVVSTIFVPLSMAVNLMHMWQVTAMAIAAYYILAVVSIPFFTSLKDYNPGLSRARAFPGALFKTDHGKLFIGTTILAVCVVFDLYDSLFLALHLGIAKYGLLVLVFGTSLILGDRFLQMHNHIAGLNRDLKEKITDLDAANKEITLSEERYKFLVEGSDDIIFILDDKLNFITVNSTLFQRFNIEPDEIDTTNFFDLLYAREKDGISMTNRLIKEQIELFLKEKDPVKLRAEFRSLINTEPIEMVVRLEYINIGGKEEIIGKASRVTDDALLRDLLYETQGYRIGNYLFTAGEISHRITRNLNKYMKRSQVAMVKIAIQEIIINAIEHGNLEITFDEKSAALEEDNYFELVASRQQNPENFEKKVRIEYSQDNEKIEFSVLDDGSGFNHKQVVADNGEQARQEMLAHGRGIPMARNIFDRIEYNESGNGVKMVKYYKKR
ncbi:MAG: hypothetical protein GY754_30150 [bacterium]|nr:hypothetical protein [bacterium]